jgi:hypothetical protein
MDAVGADQHVGLDMRAVLEPGLGAVAALGKPNKPVAEMNVFGGKGGGAITVNRSARWIVMCGAP